MTSATHKLDNDHGRNGPTAPLYQQITNSLMEDIRNGTFPIGSMLPAEAELCLRFSSSRFTVREALRWMSDHGIVDRRRGLGTIVKTSKPESDFIFRISAVDEILKYPSETFRSNIFSDRIHADPELAEKIDCPIGKEWYRISGIRRTGTSDLPICWSDIYVDQEHAHIVESDTGGHIPIYEQLETEARITILSARIRIFASSISAILSEIMKVPVGYPALTIVRRYIDERGKNFETTVTVHPQGRFELTMELCRDRASKD
jgi:DNA-binding GntR family transcriptional regulator